MKNFVFSSCVAGFLLTLSSHAIATDKYIERCGICVPSKTIKPAKKGEIVKECLLRDCTDSDPKKLQRLEDGKVFIRPKFSSFVASLLANKNPVVYREHEDQPRQFYLDIL